MMNKKWVRITIMALLGLFVLFGIARACFFSKSRPQNQYHVIARNINWNGFSFTGKEANLQAFAEELVLAVAKEAKLRVQFVSANPNTLLEDLRNHEYDVVFTFMVPDSLTRETYFFSDPLYSLGSILVVRKNSDVKSLSDMKGKIVGTASRSVSLAEIEKHTSIIPINYHNINQALSDLENNKIDGVVMDAWHAYVMTHSFYANTLKMVPPPFTFQGLRLVTLAGSDGEEFLKDFNHGLERVKASPLYRELELKWGIYDFQEQ